MKKSTKTSANSYESDAAIEHLQASLVTFVDLSLQLKQIHWNIAGTDFLTFHKQLDDIYSAAQEGVDEIAERITTLGGAADGRATTVVETTELEPLPEGKLNVREGMKMVVERLQITAAQIREALNALEQGDPITVDLFVRVCGQIEKYRWMVESQLPN